MGQDRVTKQLIPDPNLIPRVKQYLEENINQSYVDVGEMSRALQEKYREYARRKQKPFRFAVDQAYKAILRSYGVSSEPSTDGDSSDVELIEDPPSQGNRLNDMMSSVYGAATSGTSNNEANCDMDNTEKDINKEDCSGQVPGDLQTASTRPSEVKRLKDGRNVLTNGSNEHKLENLKMPSSTTPKRRRTEIGDEVSEIIGNELGDAIRAITNAVTSAVSDATKSNREQRKRPTQTDPITSDLNASSFGNLDRKLKADGVLSIPKISLKDLGGIKKILTQLKRLICKCRSTEGNKKIGSKPTRGFLLHGPTGTGKTLLARAIAGELRYNLMEVAVTELISGISGGSEKRIQRVFEQAAANAPCVLFIDEIDSIATNRENASKDMERRILTQLNKSFESLFTLDGGDQVIVIGTATNAHTIDPSLRRYGRFDKEIGLGIPDRSERVEILKICSKQLRLEPSFDYDAIAMLTPGYVGSDLDALCTSAADNVIFNIMEQKQLRAVSTDASATGIISDIEDQQSAPSNDEFFKSVEVTEDDLDGVFVTMDDFKEAIKSITPSAKREGFITAPDVTWDDIGSLSDIREELFMAISAPIKYPQRYESLRIKGSSGILLCGPPGCGKTLVAKAIANEAGINFISVKGPEMLNMYVGESERNVRKCFERAISSAPCVIFFDEFDALCPKRTGASDSPSSRIVNQLLTVMDGVELRKDVFVMAASNRPDMIDPAVLRPGRLDKILYVGLPKKQDRLEILRAQTKNGTKPPLSDDISLEEISEITESFTGADLAELIRQASLVALKESFSWESVDRQIAVGKSHFTSALKTFRPSVSETDKVKYENLRKKYGNPEEVAKVISQSIAPPASESNPEQSNGVPQQQ